MLFVLFGIDDDDYSFDDYDDWWWWWWSRFERRGVNIIISIDVAIVIIGKTKIILFYSYIRVIIIIGKHW